MSQVEGTGVILTSVAVITATSIVRNVKQKKPAGQASKPLLYGFLLGLSLLIIATVAPGFAKGLAILGLVGAFVVNGPTIFGLVGAL